MAEKKTKGAVKGEEEVFNETFKIPDARGNGTLHRRVCVDASGKVTSYGLAYINHSIHAGDNGRVVGYDNKHGYHHRHYFGKIEEITDFVSFEDIEERFQQDWLAYRSGKK